MLADLDELVLKCRHDRARTYIREAVACYKVAAYRSSIVSTWIAVAFDIVDKIHELSLAGDKAAEEVVHDLENFTDANDLPRALAFERKILTKARDVFELISAQEYLDLDRLQQDRHRCAHPSRSSLTDVFSPTAELARTHIRSAVEALLQHEPAQGKAALHSLLKDVTSEYFPTDFDTARTFLEKSALRRARPTLVRSFLMVLLKQALADKDEYKVKRSIRNALVCTLAMHPELSARVLDEGLSRLFRTLGSAEELGSGVDLLQLSPAVADALEVDQKARLQEFVRALPQVRLDELDEIAKVPYLRKAAEARANSLTVEDYTARSFFLGLPRLAKGRLIAAYTRVRTFDSANAWAKAVIIHSDEFETSEILVLLQAAVENDQIRGSFQIKNVVHALRTKSKHLPEDFDQLCERVIPKPDPPPEPEDFDDDIPF
jgi:hypothetical protein